jgi:hypothetical protein
MNNRNEKKATYHTLCLLGYVVWTICGITALMMGIQYQSGLAVAVSALATVLLGTGAIYHFTEGGRYK